MKKLFLLLTLGFATESFAYIPPPSFILSEAMKTHETIKNITVEGKVTDLRNQNVLKETLKIDFVSGKLSAVYASETESLGAYESTVKDLHRLGKFWITLAFDPSAARFHQALQELNVVPSDKTEAKLERMGQEVAWMWGSDPSIAFLKDAFLPLAYHSGNASASESILIEEYNSGASAVRVPKVVFVKLQGRDLFRYDLKSVKVNQKLKITPSSQALGSSSAKEWATLVR